jgi:predicted nucleic acid-binding protein
MLLLKIAQQPFLAEQPNPAQHLKKHEAEAGQFVRLSEGLNNVSLRLKVLEERYTNLRKKTQLTDQNLLDFEQNLREELHAVALDILEMKRMFSEIKEKLELLASEMKDAAKASDLKVLQRYLDMWQPMDFVTREELEGREKFK